ncbi:MAG: T9SS type A sorting domain-containing protein [Bacteroidota bacterium]|nr:T9SS type A sorting domain-containing protein [Bacteroidota bacterium]
MKAKITASFLKKVTLSICLLSMAELVHTYSGGPPAGYTGAPGESNCTGCHSGTPITSGTTWNDLTLTRTGGLSTVLPNASNTLTLNLASSVSTDFGFQLCVLPGSATGTSSSLGTFSVGTNSDIQTTTSTSPSRVYLMQTASGVSASSGSKSYTFNWQTPSSFAGGATFYLAFNEADGNSSSSGDNIYIKTFSVTVLPVRWLDFSAKEEQGKVVLQWSTAQEINNERFEIEQSEDGINFETIGSVKGKGNSEKISHYSFNQVNPTKLTHYRIKQIDFDGKFDYSKLISYDPIMPTKPEIFVSTTSNSIWFSHIETIKSISLYNLKGDLVANYAQINEAQLALPSLPLGIYLLRVTENDARVWHKKIWVQN